MNAVARHQWHPVLVFFGSSFILHFIWELLQGPLYKDFVISFWQHFKACLFATTTGDMLFMITIYLILAIVHRNLWWIADKTNYSHIATWTLPLIIGALLAVSYELWAVYSVHRFAYGSMPVIPLLGVGLTPILQMMVIPIISLRISSKFST